MIRSFLLLQVATSLAAAFACASFAHGSAVFHGIIGAQASLLGLWMVLGTSRAVFRLATVFLGFTWLVTSLVVHPNFNGWELVLLVLRTALASGAFLVIRSRGYAFHATVKPGEGLPFRIHIHHLLVLTFFVALALTVLRSAEDTQFAMYLYIILVGGGFASLSIVTCWIIFARGRVGWRLFCLTICAALIATALSLTAYFQTNSVATAMDWCLMSTTEATYSALSCAWLRYGRYGVTKL